MKEYHKINTIFKRDLKGNIIIGEYSLPEFNYLKNNEWIFTEKIDGTCIRIMWNGEKVFFGGKTDNSQIPIFLLYKLQELFEGMKKKVLFKNKFGEDGNVCLYGEGFGAKIQKGGGNYIKDGCSFILFDVKIADWWLERDNIIDIANYFNIKYVKEIGRGTLNEAIELTKNGFNSEFGNFLAEGLVIRPCVDLFSRNGERIITKIKYKDF